MTLEEVVRSALNFTETRFGHPDLEGYFHFAEDGKLSYYPTGYPAPLPGAQWPLRLQDFARDDWEIF